MENIVLAGALLVIVLLAYNLISSKKGSEWGKTLPHEGNSRTPEYINRMKSDNGKTAVKTIKDEK